MKLLLITVLCLLLTACGKTAAPGPGTPGKDGKPGTSCSVEQLSNGSKISCTDGSFAYIYNGTSGHNGQDGSNGSNGTSGHNGVDGSTCSVSSVVNGAKVTCSDGSQDIILNGTSGVNGTNGNNGSNGTNGTNCSVQQLTNGAKVTCGIQTAYIYDGVDAPIASFGLSKEILPCGKASSPWKEVLLCMNEGTVLGSFSENANGKNTRLANLPSGNYVDTDDSNCNFNVSVDGLGNSTVSWAAGSNQYSTWTAGSSVCTVP